MHHRSHLHCTKRRYRDPREAKVALRRAQRIGVLEREARGDSRRHEMHWYPCPRCRGYHLTSQPTLADLAVAA